MPRSQSGSVTETAGRKAKRWSASAARGVLARMDESGLSIAQFAAREGLNAKRLYWWRAALAAKPVSRPMFVEVKPIRGAAIEVISRSGHVVRVPDEFRKETLVRVLIALEERGRGC